MPSALLLTGTVGAGKTTTADAVGLLLEAASVPHAIIDLDEIRRLWPKPPSDPFASEVELRNVESLASNYLAAGADRLVLAGVCETWTQRRRYESAVAVPLVVCRLHAPPDALTARLRDRHRDEPTELAWHLDRAPELDAILDAAGVADAGVATELRTPLEVASEVIALIGWNLEAPPNGNQPTAS